MKDNTLPRAYRSEALVYVDPELVTIPRTEYAHLRRAAELLEAVDTSLEYIDGYGTSSGRTGRTGRWEVFTWAEEGCEGIVAGRGRSFQDALEDSLGLEPVSGPWYKPEPQRVPWFRLMVRGAVAGGAFIQWRHM